jgi:hypothetical protein
MLIGTGMDDVKDLLTVFTSDREVLRPLTHPECSDMLQKWCVDTKWCTPDYATALFKDRGMVACIAMCCGLPGLVEWMRKSLSLADSKRDSFK